MWIFPSPYALFMRVRMKHDKLPEFKAGATRIAAAFHQHRSSRAWAAYSTVAGPGLYAYALLPLADLADMDKIDSLDKVMLDVYGEDGTRDLAMFRDTILEMDTSVLAGVSSEPLKPLTRPPEYLYYASISLQPSKISRFIAAAKKAASAQGEKNPWFAYGTFAGRSRIHGFVVSNTIAELGSISSVQGLVEASYGREVAGQVMSEIQDAIADADTSILRYLGHGDG